MHWADLLFALLEYAGIRRMQRRREEDEEAVRIEMEVQAELQEAYERRIAA